MSTPERLKPSIYFVVIGALCVGIVGFSWGGWVTGGNANEMATSMSRNDVATALVPVCLDIARTDPERAQQIATIRDTAIQQRRDAVMDTGWATVPGLEDPDRDLAQACLAALDIDAS